MTHPLDKSATDLAADLAARRIGALELTEAAIARIEERDPPRLEAGRGLQTVGRIMPTLRSVAT